ncbi:P-loop containing nucleoside triphosphate hydrolase protein, partial [Coprinopsis sp. MPI-PUGE-AT-0042]
NDLTQGAIDWLTSSIESDTIGLYASYGARSALSRLAFATRTRVLVVSFKAGSAKAKRTLASRKRLQDTLLCSSIIKVGFLMDVLAFSLFHDLDVRVENIFNLSESSAEVSMSEFHQALGDERLASKPAVLALFNTIDKRDITANDVALHAWAAVEGGLLPHVQAKRAKRLPIHCQQLKVAAKLRRHQALLRTLVPVTVKNDITADFKVTKQGLAVVSGRFKTRIQQSKGGQTIQVAMQQGNRKVTVSGQAKKVDGRSATITSDKSAIGSSPGKILSVTTIGKELPSRSENLRAVLLRQALQDTSSVLSNPFVEAIWLPGRTPQWILDPIPTTGSYGLAPSSAYQLNPSQVQAVNSILSSASKDRTVLIHGPPGTGKTTVIAAAAHNLTLRDRSATIWLVAHSNVAVKNIAEKLAKIDFEGFKLVVSKDFHYDWYVILYPMLLFLTSGPRHEHLYQKIEHKMIRTDSLPETRLEAQRVLLDARVILCTLTTLLNDRLAPITAVVPVETLIMDEASQIEIGDYVPVINRYQHYLRKMVFIGDHKQRE